MHAILGLFEDLGVLRLEDLVSTHKKKREVVESGNAAKNYVRTTMGNAREIYPVREGVVVSVEDASLMMSEFIKRLLPEKIFSRQGVPCLAAGSCLRDPEMPRQVSLAQV